MSDVTRIPTTFRMDSSDVDNKVAMGTAEDRVDNISHDGTNDNVVLLTDSESSQTEAKSGVMGDRDVGTDNKAELRIVNKEGAKRNRTGTTEREAVSVDDATTNSKAEFKIVNAEENRLDETTSIEKEASIDDTTKEGDTNCLAVEDEDEVAEEIDEDKEDESEEELKAGLLELPLVLEKGAKRQKKKVQRLDTSLSSPKEAKAFVIQQGKGVKLGECAYIEHQLQKNSIEEVRFLHKILYSGFHKARDVKKNIRAFSGFNFGKTDIEFERTMNTMGKYTVPGLKSVCDILGTERGGKKEEIMERIMEFLMEPVDHGKAIPVGRKRGKQSKKKTKPKVEKSDKSKKKGKESPMEIKGGDEDVSDQDDDEDESERESDKETKEQKEEEERSEEKEDDNDEEEEEEEGEEKSDREEEDESGVESDEEKSPKKKPKTLPVKKESKPKPQSKPKPKTKPPAKKEVTKKKELSKNKVEPKKPPIHKKKDKGAVEKSALPKKTVKRSASEADQSTVPQKKKPKGPPSNDELKERIKKILDTADLEQVTMKTVLKQVTELYPNFDLSDKKTYMKNVVRQLIS